MTERTIRARCRRCRTDVEFPHPTSNAVSKMNWKELVLTRKDADAEYCRMMWNTRPEQVIELFACRCGGPLEVLK